MIYAMLLTAGKIEKDLRWKPAETFETGIEKPSLGIWKTVSGGKIFKIIIPPRTLGAWIKLTFLQTSKNFLTKYEFSISYKETANKSKG
jgi:hypothetical protein